MAQRGWWKLETALFESDARHGDLSDATLEHIAERIKEGYTEGEIIEETEEGE